MFRPEIKAKNNVGAERHDYLLFYRFWRCASSVWTRRPSPRRPWPRVGWGVCPIQRGRSPRPPDSGSGRLAAVAPLPRLPADHPSVFAGSIRAQVKKRSSSDAPLPHAPSRQRTVILLHTAASHLPLRPVTENREWVLAVVVIRPRQGEKKNFKGKVRITSAAPRTLTAPFGSHMTAPWGPSPGPHSRWLPSHTWVAKFTTKDVIMLVTLSSGRIELNHWPPNLKFYL